MTLMAVGRPFSPSPPPLSGPHPPCRVEYRKDTRIIDAATFIIQREDHTVGNVIRHKLLEDPAVRFSGVFRIVD